MLLTERIKWHKAIKVIVFKYRCLIMNFIQFHNSNSIFLFTGVADTYIKISSSLVQLATIDGSELEKYKNNLYLFLILWYY